MIETILLPTDFSANAAHAGSYALQLAKQVGSKKIVVYHTYKTATEAEPMVYAQVVSEPFRKESLDHLNTFVEQLKAQAGDAIEIEAYQSHANLTVAINEVARLSSAQLIVMGISGGGKLKEAVVGSHSVTVAKEANIPVLIVPTEADYQIIKKVLLVSDLKEVEETTPVANIKLLLSSTHAQLNILHIGTADANSEAEKDKLLSLLAGYNTELFIENHSDFVASVDAFVAAHAIDLVIVVPKKHGVFDGLFGTHHTKTLAFHSKVPLMAAHK
jgi:nucleotide-binding universal stress UspA family protein